MNKGLKPQIRFKGFEDDWESRFLSELGEVKMCKRIMKYQTSEKGEVPFYKIGTFGSLPDAFISKKLFEEYSQKYPFPKKGDVIISAAGTIGRIVVFDGQPSYFQDSNLIWIDNDNSIIDNSFLAVAYPLVKWATSSTTIARIYNDTVRKTKILSPGNLEEQIKLGKLFSKIANLISEAELEIERLEKMKQASLQKMFPRPGSTTPEIRFAGFNRQWKETTLNQICSYSTFPLTVANAKSKGKYPLFDANNLIGFTDLNPIRQEYISIIKDGAGVGRIRICPKNSLIIGTLGALRPNNRVDIYFLLMLLSILKLGQQYSGSTIPHIYFSDYGNSTVIIPSYEEQKQIGEYFNNLDSVISSKRQKLAKLRQIKQACLDKMFVNAIEL